MSKSRNIADLGSNDVLETTATGVDVTGTVTADGVVSNVTGNVTGDLVGNVTGNVTGDLDLTAISSTIADTAVDVFVYDTRKDSDGGAWRKRTQHTSWYNETLNTATRGARKEFPAVAVIVAESNTVTIYDGDDPSLPMWMVFYCTAGGVAMLQAVTIKAVSALNGVLQIASDIYGAPQVRFLEDNGDLYWNASSRRFTPFGIADRNALGNIYSNDTSKLLVNSYANDVAMTVLPNAPIDSATGLPVPTIAVATDGGVSVIKDDESVVDITGASGYSKSSSVYFVDTNKVAYTLDNSTATRSFRVDTIPNADTQITTSALSKGTGEEFYANLDYNSGEDITLIGSVPFFKSLVSRGNNNRVASTSGVGFLNLYKATDPSESLFSNITSSYNTGWMNGDIKLATLSDTDATNVTGTELVTNGTFDTDTSGWSQERSANVTVSGGTATHNAVASVNSLVQPLSLTVGTKYTACIEVTASTQMSNCTFQTTPNSDGSNFGSVNVEMNGVGIYSKTFTATANDVYLTVNAGENDVYSFDNISVRLAEDDRSVNNNGVQVFGTVTKSPVATGADLVAYSGFSASNKLIQPNNPDLDFGAGDWCYMGWVYKVGGLVGYIFDRANGDGTTRIGMYFSNGALNYYTSDGGINIGTVPTGVWLNYAMVKRSGVVYAYLNGELKGSFAHVQNINNDSNVPLRIGARFNGVESLTDGSLALFRASATAPTAEQISRIYNDEKYLFTDGAKATITGSSDAVTALAYDTDTELLHVGSSAGRSVFSGLRRVDETATGVTTAISASNSLIVEQ